MKEKSILYSHKNNLSLDDSKNEISESKRTKSFLQKTFEKFFIN